MMCFDQHKEATTSKTKQNNQDYKNIENRLRV